MSISLVQTVTVGAGGASSVQFTGIPQTGTDLLVLFNHRGSAAGSFWVTLETNSVAATTYRNVNVSGTTAASQGSNGIGVTWVESDYTTANVFHSMQLLIPNYTLSGTKSFSVESAVEANDTRQFGNFLAFTTGLTGSSGAVTSLRLVAQSNNFVQNTIASLYTITKA